MRSWTENLKFVFALAIALTALVTSAMAADAAEEIRQADIKFCNDTRARGLEGWLAPWAENGYVGDNPEVRGPAKLREFYTPLFARKELDFRWAPEKAEVFPSGDLGYTTGRWDMKYVNDKGDRVHNTGNYITIWKKQKDGSWKIHMDMGSVDPRDKKK